MRTKSRKTGVILVALLDLILQGYFRYIGFGVANRGVSFGLAPQIGLFVSFVALTMFFFVIKKRQYSFWLIFLGGVGNVLARLIWGNVWDYVCIPLLPFCFNLSDALISLGVVSYILRVDGNRSTL